MRVANNGIDPECVSTCAQSRVRVPNGSFCHMEGFDKLKGLPKKQDIYKWHHDSQVCKQNASVILSSSLSCSPQMAAATINTMTRLPHWHASVKPVGSACRSDKLPRIPLYPTFPTHLIPSSGTSTQVKCKSQLNLISAFLTSITLGALNA